MPSRPSTLARWITLPERLGSMRRSTCFETRKVPFRLMSTTRSHSAVSRPSTAPMPVTPAAFTSTSIRPKRCAAAATARSTAASSRTSPSRKTASGADSTTLRHAASAGFCTSSPAMLAPSRAKRSTQAPPMPEAAPVMNATLPASRPIEAPTALLRPSIPRPARPAQRDGAMLGRRRATARWGDVMLDPGTRTSTRRAALARTAARSLLLVALAGAGCSRAPELPAPDPASLRHPPAGDVVGFVSPYGSHAWRGIPYAEPPVGDLRWRAPLPAAPWGDTREALAPASVCPQLASRFGGDTSAPAGSPVGAEDCLALDVWAPRSTPEAVPSGDARLPVMVWIHGGGNVVGGARFYDGGNLAAREQVVVVALNYRLGPLGWLSHEAFRGEGTTPADRSGNYGTLDLVRALEWVRANVSAFGGDPDDVTIFGESAGARNVLSLLVAAPAKGLFQRAIVQSGGTETTPPAEAENLADAADPGERNSSGEVLLRLLVTRGRAPSRDAAKAVAGSMSPAEIASFLRGATAAELMAAYVTEEDEGLIEVPQLFRDGAVLPREPMPARLASGDFHRVPVVLGTNRDENKLFLAFDPELATWWLGLLPRLHDADRYQVLAEHMSRWWKATAADGPASAMVASGAPGVFVYRFDWDEEPKLFLIADLAQLIGAAHGFEIPFVFGHWDLGPMSRRLFTAGNAEGRERLPGEMMSYWAQFARAGAPGRGASGELPEWTAWTQAPGAPRTMVFDTPTDGGVRMAPDAVSEEEVIAAIGADPRLASQRDRCAVYWRLARWGRAFDEARYASVGCASYPIAGYPWRDAADVAAGG